MFARSGHVCPEVSRPWVTAFLNVITCLCLLLTSGCSQSARNLPLDQEVARQSLTTALTAWKDGKTPDDIQKGPHQIICGDHDWRSGMRLVSFEILPEESSDGTNLRKSCRLEFEDGAGARSTQTIEYIIGTSPVITIFRP